MRAMLPALLALWACDGPDQNFSTIVPRIAVAPAEVDFGEVAVPLKGDFEVFVTNNGKARLDADVALSDGDPLVFQFAPASFEVLPDESATLTVSFTPQTYLDYTGALTVTSNDPDKGTTVIPLSGKGVDAPMPRIEVTPQTVDFGVVAQGATGIQYLDIKNIGDAPLTLGTVTQSGSGAFHYLIGSDPSGAVLAPGNNRPVILQYTPSNDLGDSGGFTIPSDDPVTPEVDVVLLGNGGGDYEYPVAKINCPDGAKPPEWVELDGKASTDPEGHLPLTYSWSMTQRPTGSQAELKNLITDETEFFADLGGTFEVQLVVQNAVGTLSAPAKCILESVPPDEVHVELTWDTDQADIDLHLLDGTSGSVGPLFEVPGDCNWCNTNPLWAESGNSDDPRLDIDDRGGNGPENINILTPAEGRYDVMVHYFEEQGDDAVTATVKVWTFGVETWTGSKIMHRNEVWDVGQINWPDGSFGLHSVELYDAPERVCY